MSEEDKVSTDIWAAFGSDDDDDDDDENFDVTNANGNCTGEHHTTTNHNTSKSSAACEAALFLTKSLLHVNSTITIPQRYIALVAGNDPVDTTLWREALMQRGFANILRLECCDNNKEQLCDAVVIAPSVESESILEWQDKAYKILVPGGYLLYAHSKTKATNLNDDFEKWSDHEHHTNNHKKEKGNNTAMIVEPVFQDEEFQVDALQKRLCQIQERSCLWLSSKHSLGRERQRAHEATVPLTAQEIHTASLSEPSLVRSVQKLQQHGYCILPRLLHPRECQEWGRAVLDDLHTASQILYKREGVDIFNPLASQKDPQSYRELSMREDLRMDLRDGPQIRKLRGENNNKPIVLKGSETTPASSVAALEHPAADNGNTESAPNPFFRQNPSVLEVVRRTMNPKVGTLYKGNFGRYNFDGSGPDGSFQDMRLSAIGGIVSLPGSADQALHADTPHLFEHTSLPAHYINAFTPGCAADPLVGCTAFVHGSHKIEFTAQYLSEDVAKKSHGSPPISPATTMGGDNHHHHHHHHHREQVFDFLVRPQLELGDVLLFDCRTLHFGLANMSKTVERPLLYCNMTHAWFHDPKNWDNHHPIFESA